MNLSWFEWLTKSRYDMTLSDRLTGFVELAGDIILGVLLYVAYSMVRAEIRKRKHK